MKYLKIFIILIFVIIITGCHNYRELNDLGITGAIGISKDGDDFKLTFEVLKTEASAEKQEGPEYVIFESKGKTVQEASRRAILESSKRLYINHLSVLIIDEKLAKEGIREIMDLFFRDPESRKQFYVLISKADINKVMNTKGLLENLNSKSITDRLEVNKDFLANVVPITFSKMLSKYVNPNVDIIIPTVTLIKNENASKDEPENKVVIDDTAIFKKDKLVGYLNNEEALYLNLLCNEVKDSVLTAFNEKNYSTIEINKASTKVNVKNLTIKYNIKLSGNIAEINDVYNLNNPDTIKNLEKLYEDKLNKEIPKMIKKIIDDYDSDIFGFIDLIYKKDYKNYNDKLSLKDIKYEIRTEVELKYKGNGAYELNET